MSTNAFADRLFRMMNDAGLALMLSLGHRTRLLDVMAKQGFCTSDELAEHAGLAERYVREWLGAMVTGGVVEYRPEDRTYRLPADHAALLVRDSADGNVALSTQWVAVLASAEDDLVRAFRDGRGVPYERYHRFHEVMAEESGQTVVAALEPHILPLVPGLIARLEQGIDVLDVGCGSGLALLHLAQRFPNSRFRGVDASRPAVEKARAAADGKRLGNVRFEVGDAAALGIDAAVDLVTTFDAVHDQARPDAVLRGIRAALRPGGIYLMQEISGTSRLERDKEHPLGTFLYAISCMHCMSVSLAQEGAGLGAMWGRETALRMLEDAGFGDVSVTALPHDPLNLYFVAR